ncbi:MAG: ferritin-like fold-containing protein, partial [Acidimicrobiales bacterium]
VPRAPIALVQVLGAVAYGELKAYDEAKEFAAGSADPAEAKTWRTIAAEELRHHKGFVRRLEALGADPERAMKPFRASLDHFHGMPPESDDVAQAVLALLGEGVASDLLGWLRKVSDPDTARFIDTVIADEVEHEARAAEEVRHLMESRPGGRRSAAKAARNMLVRMASSSPGSGPSFTAFVRLGRAHELLAALAAGYARRLHMIGVGPLSTLERVDPFGFFARIDPFAGASRQRSAA